MSVRYRRGKPIIGRRKKRKLQRQYWAIWGLTPTWRQRLLRLWWWWTGDRNHEEIAGLMEVPHG